MPATSAKTHNIYQYYVKRRKVPKAAELEASYGDALASPEAVAAAVRRIIGKDEPREHFVVLYLDVTNKVVGYEHHATGSGTEVPAYARDLFRAALLSGAVSIILAHNHPSGRTEPSASDDALTRRLVAGGELVNIPVLDHVIVSETGHYSYATKGRL